MKQRCNLGCTAALLTLALLFAGFGPSSPAYAATITVTTFADNLTNNGDCSLREAIQAANTNMAVDTCVAGSGTATDTIQLVNGIYSLTLGTQLTVLGSLAINGVDSSTTNISMTMALDRVMQIPVGATLTLTHLMISNGHSALNGGAIYNGGTLTLTDVVVRKSSADGNGGGIFNDGGTVISNDSTITNNQAHLGGGIFNNSGTVTLNTCIINNNATSSGGAGAGIYNTASLIVNSCWIHDNQATSGDGAGIYNTLIVIVNNSTITDNYATVSGNGGNFYNNSGAGAGSLTLNNSAITNGYAVGNGGGIYNNGALRLTNITLTSNRANLGDGIYNIGVTQPISLTNSTIVSNTVSPVSPGEGIYNGSLTPIILKNTIVAYNGALGDCSGPFTSAGHNLEYNLPPNGSTCALTATGDLTGTNPLLGPFQNNSGKTFTYALSPGSPAINAGTNIGCPATDQRGRVRPRGINCDIGAYEANNAPSAAADTYTTNEDIALVVGAPGVLANDADLDGDAITASLVSGPAHGVLTLNANGAFSYTPNANYHGPDSFSYRASDNELFSPDTVVSLTVTSVNDPPIALADAYSTSRDTPLNVSQPGVLGNDTDADGDLLTATLVSGPAHGVLSLNANGSFTYTPNPSYTGHDAFSYRASDGVALSAAVNVAITIPGQNSPPIAGNDAAHTSINTPLLIPIATLLLNDSDPNDDPLTITDVRGNSARGGQVMLTGSTITYTPPTQFTGIDSFIYTLSDGNGGTANGTVTVTVGLKQLYLPLALR